MNYDSSISNQNDPIVSFNIPKVINYFGDRTLKKRLPYLLNSLPAEIRQISEKVSFKNKLNKYYLNIC